MTSTVGTTSLPDDPTGGASGDVPSEPTYQYLNRELSWLDFNSRVLDLATEPGIPLLERAKFCAIFSSNLDEFFQVRVAALRDQVAAGIDEPSADGRTPLQQLTEISERVPQMVARQEAIFLDELVPQLAEAGISILSMDEWTSADGNAASSIRWRRPGTRRKSAIAVMVGPTSQSVSSRP